MRKSYCNTVGRRFPIGNAYSYTEKKGYFYLCVWMTLNWLERNKILIRCGSYSTTAKVMDIISRLPGCSGQAADAVSAFSHVKMEDAPSYVENSKIGMSRQFGFVYHDTYGQNHGPVSKIWSFLQSENLYGHPMAGLLWERQCEKILLKYGWEKYQIGNAYSLTDKRNYSYLCNWIHIKLAGKKPKY